MNSSHPCSSQRGSSLSALLAAVGGALLLSGGSLSGAGTPFTEPPVTFYGSVNQTADGYTRPVPSGTVKWVITPPSGSAINVSVALTLAGQGSYRLKIPVEKVPSGAKVSANTIYAPSASTAFGRTNVTLDGAALSIVYPTGAAAGSFAFNEAARGKIDRVDLTLTQPFTDSDGDGLPDWFEDLYGLDKYNPYDAAGFDAFGQRTLLYDYQHHIDPSKGTEYEQWATVKLPATAPKDPNADADRDGVNNLLEFALDTDPQLADAPLSRQKTAQSMVTVSGKQYLALTINLPATPRSTVNYVVESSGDLKTWASAPNTDVVTVASTASQLQVRDAKATDSSPARYLRLRVTLTQP